VLKARYVRDESQPPSRGEDAIYFAAAKNRYVGSVPLGYGPDGKRIRRKVFGKTKQEVRDRLKALHQELNSGVRSSSRRAFLDRQHRLAIGPRLQVVRLFGHARAAGDPRDRTAGRSQACY
jgi:hypothetical protein